MWRLCLAVLAVIAAGSVINRTLRWLRRRPTKTERVEAQEDLRD